MRKEDAKTPLAERLREAREYAGLSQAQVAKLLGLHRPTVTEIEAGRRKVTAEELTRFAEAYGVTLAWLTDKAESVSQRKRLHVELAARELSKLRDADLERIIKLLVSLRGKKRGEIE